MDIFNEPISIRRRYHHPLLDPRKRKGMTTAQVEKEIKEHYDNDQMKMLVAPKEPNSPANLVSSLCEDGQHRPALDIDVPCELIPSSTEGHHHLYFPTVNLSWEDYRLLLEVLAHVGIIEPGYRDMSMRDKQSFLRLPGTEKIINRTRSY